jgi:heme-degrading monooxygenase HmoA
MFVTIVEGVVDPGREDDLRSAWERRPSPPPAGFIESFLLRGENAATWRIATVWESREAVTAMRASVKRPPALVMFDQAGVADPNASFWTVEGHASPS